MALNCLFLVCARTACSTASTIVYHRSRPPLLCWLTAREEWSFLVHSSFLSFSAHQCAVISTSSAHTHTTRQTTRRNEHRSEVHNEHKAHLFALVWRILPKQRQNRALLSAFATDAVAAPNFMANSLLILLQHQRSAVDKQWSAKGHQAKGCNWGATRRLVVGAAANWRCICIGSDSIRFKCNCNSSGIDRHSAFLSDQRSVH